MEKVMILDIDRVFSADELDLFSQAGRAPVSPEEVTEEEIIQ